MKQKIYYVLFNVSLVFLLAGFVFLKQLSAAELVLWKFSASFFSFVTFGIFLVLIPHIKKIRLISIANALKKGSEK